ncbi:MAG TPA: AAA family ATPase [Gaiellaceae bacterium]|nr:AAA family ATPase [Gaiellaceae bacterium]
MTSRPNALAVLRALRAQGLLDAMQGEHEWAAECPICLPHSGGHFLRISERREHGPADLSCRNRCDVGEILTALGLNGALPGRLRARGVQLDRVVPFEWAWEDRLLLGYLNLLVGDEGVGKGTFLAWLIARLTRGELPGDLQGESVRVLIVGDEDGFDNVTVPRLIAAGARTQQVLDLPTLDGGALDIARDAGNLADLLREEQVRVVIFDQLLDNLGDVDTWKGKQVRAALAPARHVAADLGVCFVCSLHTNKSRAETFRQRVADSQAFNALSRSSLLLAEHPEDPGRRVLVRGKGNYAAPPKALEFTIGSEPVEISGHLHRPTKILGLVESDVLLDDVLQVEAPTSTKANGARETIAEALADGEWHDAAPIRAALMKLGVSSSGIKRAARDLVERRRTQGFPSTNEWRLLAPTRARGGAPTGPTEPTGPTDDSSGSSGSSGSSQTVPPRVRARAASSTEGDDTP